MRTRVSGAARPIYFAALAIAIMAAACAPAAQPDPYAGRFLVKGGGAAFEITQPLTAAFTKVHPRVTWDFEDLGSRGGMAAVDNGEADLGTASIDLLPEYAGRVEQRSIGVSGTGIVVAAANPVTGLTRDQVRDIFSGVVTDWSAVGGTPGKIALVVRSPDTAIWTNFKAFFFDANTSLKPGATFAGDLTETVKAVKSLSVAIGVVTTNGTTRADASIRLLKIDGVGPSVDNLRSGAYGARRPLYLLFKSTGLKPTIRAFLDFVQSPEGQSIIAQYQ
ncbi:MAG TPA: substrate-binding domain-containing protein [Candidatus Limnocylindria bacterium]|nr:substrate-binding domain-containing protein [Candidatus Limnocylindria bacterium]